jgi:hypothetical protein
MNDWPSADIEAEVGGGRRALAGGCSIPAADVVGFRAPFLQSRPPLRQVCFSRLPLMEA